MYLHIMQSVSCDLCNGFHSQHRLTSLLRDINLCSEQSVLFCFHYAGRNGKYVSCPKPHNRAFNFWDPHPNPELVDFSIPKMTLKTQPLKSLEAPGLPEQVSLPTKHFGFLFVFSIGEPPFCFMSVSFNFYFFNVLPSIFINIDWRAYLLCSVHSHVQEIPWYNVLGFETWESQSPSSSVSYTSLSVLFLDLSIHAHISVTITVTKTIPQFRVADFLI